VLIQVDHEPSQEENPDVLLFVFGIDDNDVGVTHFYAFLDGWIGIFYGLKVMILLVL